MASQGDPRVQRLEEELARVRAAFDAVLDAAPAELLARPYAGGWSPAQVVWHLAKTERSIARMIEAKVAALGPMSTVPPGPRSDEVLSLLDHLPFLDRSRKARAPEGLNPPDVIDLAAECVRLGEGRRQLLEVAYAAGPLLSNVRHDHPAFGPFNGWQWVLMVARHEQRHQQQVEEALAGGR